MPARRRMANYRMSKITKECLCVWWAAARPRTLWAAVAPVLVGTGLAVGHRVFRADAAAAALLGALAIQIAANFANDASDAKRGADSPDRVGPPRAVASGALPEGRIWYGVWIMFGLAAAAGAYLTVVAGWAIPVLGAACVLAALAYTGGPLPYGYRGLGEIFVFLFFGLAATVGSRYVHDMTAPAEAWLAAVPVGFLATAILVANNVRDVDTDAAVGKRTLAVILGAAFARRLYVLLVVGAHLWAAGMAAAGLLPRWSALALLAAPWAVRPVRDVISAAAGPDLIRALEATARLHLLFGLGLAIGAAIG